jgi:hypothetical protein
MPRFLAAAFCLAFLVPSAAQAAFPELPGFGKKDEKDTRVSVEFVGVEGELLANVRALSAITRRTSPPASRSARDAGTPS